ncbi:BlaI/MecI/CopY family transcriptional regulator [bacterium]|nr:BlaI/MecI/CopY family transcriptional regulator [bacterium]
MALFTAGELEVMQVLWDHGALSPPQMQERFPRPIHNATLRSMLLVLLEKGHVTRHKIGRAYVYEARTPQQNTLKKMVRRITDVFCGGSPTALIAQIIQSEKLSADDIKELQRVLKQTGPSTRKGNRR